MIAIETYFSHILWITGCPVMHGGLLYQGTRGLGPGVAWPGSPLHFSDLLDDTRLSLHGVCYLTSSLS